MPDICEDAIFVSKESCSFCSTSCAVTAATRRRSSTTCTHQVPETQHHPFRLPYQPTSQNNEGPGVDLCRFHLDFYRPLLARGARIALGWHVAGRGGSSELTMHSLRGNCCGHFSCKRTRTQCTNGGLGSLPDDRSTEVRLSSVAGPAGVGARVASVSDMKVRRSTWSTTCQRPENNQIWWTSSSLAN